MKHATMITLGLYICVLTGCVTNNPQVPQKMDKATKAAKMEEDKCAFITSELDRCKTESSALVLSTKKLVEQYERSLKQLNTQLTDTLDKAHQTIAAKNKKIKKLEAMIRLKDKNIRKLMEKLDTK